MNTRQNLLYWPIAAALAASGIIPAMTQAASPNPVALEEIVVTAQRVETSLQRTPVSVTALTAEALEQRGIKNLLDVGNFTPNLVIGSRAHTSSTSGGLSIRGIGVDGTAQAAVGLYIDEVYYPSGTGNLLNLLDIDRIEVLRGPQGTLFGRNTIAGAVQYVTVKPSQTTNGFAQVSAGNLETSGVRGALNVPISDDVAVRLAAAYDKNGGYVDDTLNGFKRGEDEVTQYRAQLRWTPGDRLTLDLKAEGFKEETNGRAAQVEGYNDNAALISIVRFINPSLHYTDAILSTSDWQNPGFDGKDFFNAYYNEGQLVAAYKLSDSLTVKSISAYSETRTRSVLDGDDSPLPLFTFDTVGNKTQFFTEELQLNGSSFADRLKWTLGYYYYDTKVETPPSVLCLNILPCSSLGAASIGETTANAFYGQGTFSFTDRLSLLLGLRYSKEDTTVENTGFASVSDQSFDDTSPAIGLNFQATPDTLFYVKASKGFRGGGTTAVPPTVSPTGFIPFDPETAWTYEGGLRWQSADARVRVNPTIFYTDWKEIQFNSLKYFSQLNTIVTENAGDARLQGAEVEAQFAVTDKFIVTGSASYLDSEYTRVEPTVAGVTTDTDLQRAPEYKFAVGGRYTHTLSSGATIAPSLDYSYTDEQRSAVTDADFVQMPAYGLLNGRVQYESPSGTWSIAAYGTNLTNEFYLIGGINFVQTAGTLVHDPGRPRQYGLDLRVNF